MREVGRTEYKQGFLKESSERVFMPFNKDGEVDTTVVKAASLVEQKLAKYSPFISVGYRGSGALGYSDKNSDIDLSVFYDTSKQDNDSRAFYSTLTGLRAVKIHGREIHAFLVNINLETLKGLFKIEGGPIHAHYSLHRNIAALCGLARGHRIGRYRENFAKWVATLPDSEQRVILNGVTENLVGWENDRVDKIQGRMQGSRIYSDTGAKTFIDSRRKLWRERVAQILQIKES